MKKKMRQATMKMMGWTIAWTLSVALATFAPKLLWEGNRALTIVALVINLGVGVGMIIANRDYLAATDEMQRKIQLDAMAISLGAGLVGGIAYTIMDKCDLIAGDAEISSLIVYMTIVYMISIVVGRIRYS